MSRAPFQILVLPFRVLSNDKFEYAVFKRDPSTGGFWQFIAGGGEKQEDPIDAAKREAYEEAGISQESKYYKLDSQVTIPVVNISGFKWGKEVLVIPEYCFGVKVESEDVKISHEHLHFKWLPYKKASKLLRWDSNKNALWELDHRLNQKLLPKIQ